jgi:prepilin-type N-terminal cleavage/methylation domain-containing protein
VISADAPSPPTPAAPVSGARPANARRREGGFTLVEMLLAFAILAVTMAYLIQTQTSALRMGAKARDLRDIRVMSDTVFRKALYEIWQWQDGQSSTADQWYGDFARLKGSQKDQWKAFRLVFHKQKRMAAGNDPSGKVETLDASDPDGTASKGSSSGMSSGSSGSSGGSSSGSGAGTSGTDPANASGEPVYVVWLEVYTAEDSEQPDLTLRTIVPVPEIELEQDR